ncbi:MAG: serine hydrolase [Acidobacteriota bacterium]
MLKRLGIVVVHLLFFTLLVGPLLADGRVPGDTWMSYVDPAEAGFDADKLAAAKTTWESLPSAAFMVIADGAVVAAWGDTNRRFMCHSVRKSFLSGLYGIYWDRGEIDLNKTLFDLGIDDTPDPLLDNERQARILDLLKARSGIFHPAAYAGRTDSAARGSKGAGRYFAYNNWDFNTLATILIEETGDDVFEAFDEHFGQPLDMEDWRVSDGYYHLERDKSRYPAYPFRMSARDAARFGLLFAREGMWGDEQVLSKHWVRRSAAMYSIDNESIGYGFMWWVYREPRFAQYDMYSALGVGNQMIAVLPAIDLVIINRANTFDGQSTPSAALYDLVEAILEARTGAPSANAALEPLADTPRPNITTTPTEQLLEYAGRWPYPPEPLGLDASTWVDIEVGDGHLIAHAPQDGTFAHYLQADGSFHEEDSHGRYLPVRDADGVFAGIASPATIANAALAAHADGNATRGDELMSQIAEADSLGIRVNRVLITLLRGDPDTADAELRALTENTNPRRIEGRVNATGYRILQTGKNEVARDVFALNTRVFPDSANVWDSLAESQMALGAYEASIANYQKTLELEPDNPNAVKMIETMKAKMAEQ